MKQETMLYYLLDGHRIVPEADLMVWAKAFENMERSVGDTTIGSVRISTVFLGIDHNLSVPGPPVLFETMIFEEDSHGSAVEGLADGDCERYCTWAKAREGHLRWCKLVGSGAEADGYFLPLRGLLIVVGLHVRQAFRRLVSSLIKLWQGRP